VWIPVELNLSLYVMRGPDPRIHLLPKMMDCRVKPGNDDRDSKWPETAVDWPKRAARLSCRFFWNVCRQTFLACGLPAMKADLGPPSLRIAVETPERCDSLGGPRISIHGHAAIQAGSAIRLVGAAAKPRPGGIG
jgi:hypothetical protein